MTTTPSPPTMAALPKAPSRSRASMHLRRRGSPSLSSASSASACSDDEDAITPCPRDAAADKPQVEVFEGEANNNNTSQQAFRPPSPSSHQTPRRSTSWREEEGGRFHPVDGEGDDVDNEQLWRRMLAIQRIFGCYKSARMSAALEAGVQDGGVPSKTCLDLLNDSINQLPEDSRRQVDQFLQYGTVKRRTTNTKGPWWRPKLHLHHGPSFKA